MDEQDALALIKEALCEVAPENASYFQQLTLDAHIKDLGIDSVRILEMVGAIEDRLARTFPEDELTRAQTLRSLATLIHTEHRKTC